MEPETDWSADEAFWEWAYPFMFPASRFEAAPEEVAQLLALYGAEEGQVLDLACGPGRHSVAFAVGRPCDVNARRSSSRWPGSEAR